MPLKAVGTPSMMAILSPSESFAATASPTIPAPSRLSGPTNGMAVPVSARASASSLLSMFTITIPASAARFKAGTSALESAGAMTIASTPRATICSTMFTWAVRSVSLEMPLTMSSYFPDVFSWASAPSAMVLKNSLASDLVTRATTGFPEPESFLPQDDRQASDAAAARRRGRNVDFFMGCNASGQGFLRK